MVGKVGVAHQDITILTELDPIRTPVSNSKELLMPADKGVVRYREWLERWGDRGWRIDVETLRAKRGDIAFAIPSPARRTSGNWVVDPVPLLPAIEEESASTPKSISG